MFQYKKLEELEGRPKEVVLFLSELILGKIDANFWIAGGCLRNLIADERTRGDIDCYFPSPKDFSKVLNTLQDNGFEVNYESTNALNLIKDDLSFDLIKTCFESMEATILGFDFTVCCCATDGKKLVYQDLFFQDLENRHIRINSCQDPSSLLPRLQKYIMKGYLASDETFVAIKEIMRGSRLWGEVTKSCSFSGGSSKKLSGPFVMNIIMKDNRRAVVANDESIIDSNYKEKPNNVFDMNDVRVIGKPLPGSVVTISENNSFQAKPVGVIVDNSYSSSNPLALVEYF